MTYTERFIQITEVYPEIFINEREFSKKLGYKSSSTVNSWMNGKTKKINAKNRSKICDIFGLLPNVWEREQYTERFVTKNIRDLEIITEEEVSDSKIKELIFDEQPIKSKERYMLDNKIKESIENMDRESPEYMFEYAKELKRAKKITQSLKVLEMIYKHPSNYKYTHYNEIEHFKAILLSHDKIKDWDGAIDILKRLYSSTRYHIKNQEVITLIASNYKRKALYDKKSKNLLSKGEVDMDLLVNAITIYKEAYNLKEKNEKYYDAINYAYLHNIIDAIEPEEASPREIKKLYNELVRVWEINKKSWWHISSHAEFLMLLGKTDLAILEINDFLENHIDRVTPFKIDATMRQLEIYIHFTQDANAIKFYEHLKSSWEVLRNIK